VLGLEHSGRVRGVGLWPTPDKSTSYTTRQGSISSAPTPKELEMAAEMERLKTLYEAQNIKLQEQGNQLQQQNNKHEAQQEELAVVKHMVAMIMVGKQPSMGNKEEGDVLVYTYFFINQSLIVPSYCSLGLFYFYFKFHKNNLWLKMNVNYYMLKLNLGILMNMSFLGGKHYQLVFSISYNFSCLSMIFCRTLYSLVV
jgi:hypothetical protein